MIPSKTLSECPVEKIREIAEEHPEICVNLQKRDIKGKLANLPQEFMPITDLIDGALVERLRDSYGGGDYRIDPRDRETRQVNVVDAYTVTISGPAKAVGTLTDSVARPAVRPLGSVPSYREQAAVERAAQQHDPNTIWSAPPDAIALGVAEDYRNQAAALQRKFDATVEKMQRANDDLRNRLDLQSRESVKKENESKLELLRQEIQALANKPVAKPSLDGTAIVGLVTAAGGIVTALLTSAAQRQQAEAALQTASMERQQRAAEQQMNMILGLFKKDDKGNSTVDILKVVAPLLTPLLPKLLEGRDPTKAAELLSSMAENQMSMLSMVATSMQNMMGEPANPLMQMFQETISGVIAAAGKASEIAQQQNPARNIPGVPQNKPIAPPQAEPVTEVVQQAPHSAVAVANPPSNGRPLTAPQLATQLLQHPNWPDDMKHPEWKTILVEMHGTAPAESVGVRVANILETMHNKGILREDLARVFTDDSNQPASEFLRPIFDTFPVAESDPDRYLGILRGIDGEIGDFEVTEEAATQEDTP